LAGIACYATSTSQNGQEQVQWKNYNANLRISCQATNTNSQFVDLNKICIFALLYCSMYLKSITTHGFKSFADKTVLEFLPPVSGRLPTIGIVGPNGSGKSNVADAVRWVLGEQSVKAVRGKKSEDVIFAGSGKRARSSMAEVQLTVVNDDRKIPIDVEEVTISRRLYRDGESEYLLNNKTTRLMDIQLLIAKASFGKEGYSVIGQGQIDAILTASPEERKTFFDEATGVRPLQIKKDQALKKLATTEENLWQAQMLQEEIAPRLRSLTRQVKRLEQREEIEKELHALQEQYYGTLMAQSETEYKKWYGQIIKTQEHENIKTLELRKIEQEMRTLEKSETKPAELLKIQTDYEKLIARKEKLRDLEFELKRKLLETKKETAAVPTYEITQILEGVRQELEALLLPSPQSSPIKGEEIKQSPSPRVGEGRGEGRLRTLLTTVSDLIGRLKGEKAPASAVSITKELEEITKELHTIDQELERLRSELQKVGKAAEEKKQSFFEIQRKLSAKQAEVHALEEELGNAKIELAKIETKRDALETEARQEMGERYTAVQHNVASDFMSDTSGTQGAALLPEIQRLKRQLESIGSIDQETIKEYKEVKERSDFLEGQIADLQNSLQAVVTLLEELERTIRTQFENAFEKINTEFGNYFKILFGGGAAKLTKLIAERENEEQLPSPDPLAIGSPSPLGRGEGEGMQPSLLDKFTKKDSYRGIDISATPPGKKLKSIAMLSGGEKALTSIALLAAILALNPPPFVMLDEVDAALDESNSARFAAILTELAHRTQFIVITHNRATMHACEVLYGVTMGDDGVSKLLSLKFEEAASTVSSP